MADTSTPAPCTHLDAMVTTDASGEGRHATAHFQATNHPIIQSYEPGEDWDWCYVDQLTFQVPGGSPTPSHR